MEVLVRLIGAFQLVIAFLAWPYHIYLSYKKPYLLPPIKSSLLTISAVELARKIRRREIKSKAVVEAYIQRIKEVNPTLNAIASDRFAEALADADKVDEYLSTVNMSEEAIKKQTPLLGVPITVKESIGVKGLSFTVGSLLRRDLKAADDGDSVKNVRKAGAIPLAVTTTPEFCTSWETDNIVTGVTKNPYNVYRTCGGSSGGEGALMGSAASLIGIGSDIAGSIRIPAMYNGVYGHKPSPGFVSLNGHFPQSDDKNFSNFLVIGPMARYVEDLNPLLKIMSGERAPELRLDEEVDISKMKIFYKEDAGFSLVAVPVDREIKSAIKDAAKFLKDAHNCQVEEADLKEMEDSVEISAAVFLGMEGIPDIREAVPTKKNEGQNIYLELLKANLGYSEFSITGLTFSLIVKHNLFIPKEKYGYYCEQNENLRKKMNEMLKDNGVFIYPTHPIPALHHKESLYRTAGAMYTMIFNTLQLPSTHVPTGLDRNGLPIGFQVVAAEKQDRLCLAVAKALDAKFGGWVPPPTIQSEL